MAPFARASRQIRSRNTLLNWKALKRVCRYLRGRPRLTYVYKKQDVKTIAAYVDTDWAGCERTRKSTSGGAVMLGQHALKHWSSTQPIVSLSSGEAEFYAAGPAAARLLYHVYLLRELGRTPRATRACDSSAARGVRILCITACAEQRKAPGGRRRPQEMPGRPRRLLEA